MRKAAAATKTAEQSDRLDVFVVRAREAAETVAHRLWKGRGSAVVAEVQGLRRISDGRPCLIDDLHDSEQQAFLYFQESRPVEGEDVGHDFDVEREGAQPEEPCSYCFFFDPGLTHEQVLYP